MSLMLKCHDTIFIFTYNPIMFFYFYVILLLCIRLLEAQRRRLSDENS